MKQKIIRLVAGILILTGILLSIYVNQSFIWLSTFVGVNLFQSSLTGFCPLEKILERAGIED